MALSSAEAEYIAASEAVREVLFVVQMLDFMKVRVEMPVTVRVDNMELYLCWRTSQVTSGRDMWM